MGTFLQQGDWGLEESVTYSAPLGVSVWRSPVQTQASPQALVPSAVACSVPFPQHRWRNWDSEDTGHVQAPETPAASYQDSTRPCSHTHLLCPAQDVGFCSRASWDTPPGLSYSQLGRDWGSPSLF